MKFVGTHCTCVSCRTSVRHGRTGKGLKGSREAELGSATVSGVCILAGDRREPRETIDITAGIKQRHEIILLKLNHVENI